MNAKVILVDKDDKEIGVEEKIKAHQQALLHRAFSVFIYRKQNDNVELLLQQRHPQKYHCGGLWTNTCCSHPQPGETVLQASTRRLHEEMGIEAKLQEIGVFTYRAEFDNGLTEYEVDHVLIGELAQENFAVNHAEIANYRWLSIKDLESALQQNPELYTPWLLQALSLVKRHLVYL